MSSKARKPYLKTDHFKGGGSIHELAANAVKYGALSAPDGSVAVDWTLDGDIAAPDLRLTWQEHGGPPVAAPTRRGFGSRLIERGLAGTVDGEVSLSYPPSGVTCLLVAPLSGFAGGADRCTHVRSTSMQTFNCVVGTCRAR